MEKGPFIYYRARDAVINEEYFFNTGKYLGAEWSNVWDKRICIINGSGERLWFDIDIEYLNSSTKAIVS